MIAAIETDKKGNIIALDGEEVIDKIGIMGATIYFTIKKPYRTWMREWKKDWPEVKRLSNVHLKFLQRLYK